MERTQSSGGRQPGAAFRENPSKRGANPKATHLPCAGGGGTTEMRVLRRSVVNSAAYARTDLDDFGWRRFALGFRARLRRPR